MQRKKLFATKKFLKTLFWKHKSRNWLISKLKSTRYTQQVYIFFLLTSAQQQTGVKSKNENQFSNKKYLHTSKNVQIQFNGIQLVCVCC